ncbi:fluoride efflux transporter FluC [Nocardioides pacificus]
MTRSSSSLAVTPLPAPSLPALCLLVAVGGAAGALLRWGLGQLAPDGSGFPWTTFAVNVVGSILLALLPALPAVRRRLALTTLLGPGLLGGFTTLSAWSEQTRALVDAGDGALAASYAVGTLGACLVGVALADLLSTRPARMLFDAEGGDL